MKIKTQFYVVSAAVILSLAYLAAEQPPKSPCCSNEVSAISISTNPASNSDVSLFQVESQWTTDSGRTIQLSDFRGKPQIITMFFAHCEYACPLLVHDMQRLEKALPDKLRSKVGFTLVTFDTERDTPEALKKYRSDHHLGENWTLLRSNSDDVLELAALLSVKFKKDERGQFAHSNIITVLDSKGEIVFQQIGLNRDLQSAIAALQKLF